MRVLWLSHSSMIGGAELALVEGVRALVDRGHEVDVVLPSRGPLAQRLEAASSISVVHSNFWTVSTWSPPVPTAMRVRWLMYNVLHARSALIKLAQSLPADVLVTNTIAVPTGALAAKALGVPHIWFLHEFGHPEHGLKYILGRRTTYALIRRLADLILVNSETMRHFFAKRLRNKSIRVASYAVETPHAVEPASKTGRSWRLVTVGLRSAGKGQKDAIEATSLLITRGVDVCLELIGDSVADYERDLLFLTKRLGVSERVVFRPFRENPFDAMAGSDAVIVCSRMEAFGRVTIEAMKLGRPVVGARSGATAELITDGWNGLLYDPGNSDELARQLERLYRHPGMAQKIGEQARQWASDRFSLESYGNALEQSLEAAIGAHAGHGRRHRLL